LQGTSQLCWVRDIGELKLLYTRFLLACQKHGHKAVEIFAVSGKMEAWENCLLQKIKMISNSHA